MSAPHECIPRLGDLVQGVTRSIAYSPPSVPSPLMLPKHDPAYAPLLRAAGEMVYLVGVHDPLAACRSLARALKPQSRGGKASVLRCLVRELAAGDAELLDYFVVELSAAHVKQHLN